MCTLIILLLFLIIALKIFKSPNFVSSNRNFDREINNVIRGTVAEMLRVYYGGFDVERLEEILSEELLNEVLTANRFRRFREKSGFFLVDSNYMQTLQKVGENSYGEQLFNVRVGVNEGFFECRTIHVLAIRIGIDGSGVIEFIEYDR